MGHGDDLALVDRNFPAASATGKLVQLSGLDTTQAAKAILTLFPLDSFVEAPIRYMEAVDGPQDVLAVHRDMEQAAQAAEGAAVAMAAVERHAFYRAARESYAVVQTDEARPYGCFLLKKGVILD
jgi:L-fucose mutarotase